MSNLLPRALETLWREPPPRRRGAGLTRERIVKAATDVADADGLVLADTAGRRQVVHGDMVRFPGAPGPHRLETPLAAVVALTR